MNKLKQIYKSQSFIKQIKEIDSNFISKYIFIILMTLILSTASSFMMGFGYGINNEISQTLRAVAIFGIGWFCLFFIWWIKQTIFFIKLSSNKSKYIELFSFLPIFNIVSVIRLSKLLKQKEFFNWISNPFKVNLEEVSFKNYKTREWYLNLICFIVMSPTFWLTWFPEYGDFSDPALHNLWFEGYHYFTIQTNLLCFIYCFVFVVYPKMKLFNKDSILICLMSYLFVVGFTYDFIMLPSISKTNWSALKWTKTCWDHIINPILFIAIGIYNLYFSSEKRNAYQDYLTVLKFGMIIPSIYLIYALVLPFVTNCSVYWFITNCNPNLPNEQEGALLAHGEWYLVFVIIFYWFVFVGIITMFWRIKYSFCIKSTKINNEINKNTCQI